MTADAPNEGRPMRLRVHARLGLWIAILVSLGWTVAMVAAPLTIPPGTVVGLNGGANRLDYGDLWAKLPPVQGAIYYIGDIECHQKATRTIFLNGNEMPVCARDASLFFFLSVGLALAAVVRPDASLSRSILRMMPARLRERLEKGWRPVLFSWFLAIVMLLPVAIDGGAQLLTSYESTNVLRFLTGIPAGTFLGLVLGLMIMSIYALPSPRHLPQLDAQPEHEKRGA